MAEIKTVKLSSLKGGRKSIKYRPYIDAAMAMPSDEAVHVDMEGINSLSSLVHQAIVYAGLSDKIRVKTREKQVYIVKR